MTLANRHVVVTRAPHQADDLVKILHAHQAVPLLYPCIDITPPKDTTLLDEALYSLQSFDWLVVTSVNTVLALARRIEPLGIKQVNVPVAAVGPSTAQAVQDMLSLSVSIIPDQHTGEALARAIDAKPGMRILLPQSGIARPDLAQLLSEAGVDVTIITAYETTTGTGGVDLPDFLARGAVDALTFASSSAVHNFVKRITAENGSLDTARNICAACIGPITGETAYEHNFTNIITPQEYTLQDMASTLADYFGSKVTNGSNQK
jgi:uroporphyrinogen-III synthase